MKEYNVFNSQVNVILKQALRKFLSNDYVEYIDKDIEFNSILNTLNNLLLISPSRYKACEKLVEKKRTEYLKSLNDEYISNDDLLSRLIK